MRLTQAEAAILEQKGLLPKEEKPKTINHYAPYRSKWEQEYAEYLNRSPFAVGKHPFEVRYERVSFCLVPATATQKGVWYLPDFTIWSDGLWEVHEVKGFWRGGAKHKVKALAAMLRPIPVYVVRKVNGNWERERF